MAHAHAARRIPHRAEAFPLHRVVPVKFSLSLFLEGQSVFFIARNNRVDLQTYAFCTDPEADYERQNGRIKGAE